MEGKLKTQFRSFQQTLCDLVNAEVTTNKECGDAIKVTPQTIGNWCSGRTAMDEDDAHRLMLLHPNPRVRRELANARISGGEFFPPDTVIGDTDVNRDGRTDEHDAILALAAVASAAAHEMEDLVGEARGGLTDEQKQRISQGLYSLREKVNLTIGVVNKAAGKGGRRS